MKRSNLTRRVVLQSATVGTVAVLAAPYVRSAYTAGRLTLGCWDHWVPGANNALTNLCNQWGEKTLNLLALGRFFREHSVR